MVGRRLSVLLLVVASCISEKNALGTYCCERPGEKDCITLLPDGVYTRLYQVHDSTYSYTGTWHMSEGGGRIALENYHPRTLAHFKPLGTGITDANVPFDDHEITMMEDLPEYNYCRVN